jgi:hypothetical protein
MSICLMTTTPTRCRAAVVEVLADHAGQEPRAWSTVTASSRPSADVRTVINGRDTYRMQLVCDGHPTRRHPVGDGRVSFDLGPSDIAVAVQRADGTWRG